MLLAKDRKGFFCIGLKMMECLDGIVCGGGQFPKKTQFCQIFKISQQVIKGLSAFYLPLSATVSSCNITGVQVIIVYPLSPLCSFTGGQKCSMKVLLKCPWFKIFCALLGARCHRWWPKDWDKAVFASESRRCCSIVMSFEKATQANLMSASRAVTTGPSQKNWLVFSGSHKEKHQIKMNCRVPYYDDIILSFGQSFVRANRCWSTSSRSYLFFGLCTLATIQ